MKPIDEDDIFIRKSAIETTCGCQQAKCGPHRCGPSRVAWGMIIVLSTWILVLLSYDSVGQDAHLQRIAKSIEEQLNQQRLDDQDAIRHQVNTLSHVAQQSVEEEVQQMRELRGQLDVLRRVLQTPAVKKKLDVLQRVTH